jgi:K+-sensing histidine kinase KdpD
MDGRIFDCAALPLPDGATLMTSLDVTAGVNIERALTERNQALIAAEKLRNDFVNHVSYELRTPLTNIIGFTQLLAGGGVGPLNPKQVEYAGFITDSSHALLAIIDDILDLASMDAGALELRLEDVDVAEAMKAAAAGVQDRLSEAAIELRIVMTDGSDRCTRTAGGCANLVQSSLTINYSEAGQTVTLAAMRRGRRSCSRSATADAAFLRMIDRVFERFETFPNGSRHRGPGLGLSIVRAMVECMGVGLDRHGAREVQRSPASFPLTQWRRRRRARNCGAARRKPSSRGYERSRRREGGRGRLDLRGAERGDDLGHRCGAGGVARA